MQLLRTLGVLLAAAWAATSSCSESPGWTDGDPRQTLADVHILGGATLLENGQVLAAGGLNRLTFQATAVAELYDPVARQWTKTGPLNTPRWSLDAITLSNGKALFAGGAEAFAEKAALATAEIYDPATGQFTFTMNSLSVARQSFGISLLNDGRVLITGGNTTGNNLGGTGTTAVDIYDPATNSFQPAAAMSFGRSLHAQLTLRSGKVLVIGGAQVNAEIYDPELNSWTTAAESLPTTLKDMKAFELFDGRVFIPGGQNTVDGLTADATWFFDVARGKFTPGPSLAGFCYAPAGVQIGTSDYSGFDLFPQQHDQHGRYILIAGGEHDPPTGPDVELHSAIIFDAAADKFIDVGPMPFIHDDHTESLLRIHDAGHPEVLLFGGNSTRRTSRYEFDLKTLLTP